tara:strand:+ start:312 stop:1244 length:933 start_codon:yes stop_codon:yes gene_type:complete
MAKIIIKYLISLFIVVTTTSWALIEFSPKKNDFLKGLQIKHKRAFSIQGKKIILNGGSNLAFGINSKLIEDSTGFPVSNLGIMAGLGFEYMIEQTKYYSKPGDIVILIPEFFLYATPESSPTSGIILNSISALPESKHFIKKKLPHIVLQYKIQNALKRTLFQIIDGKKPDGIYSLSSFNEYGDVFKNKDTLLSKNLFDNYVCPLERDLKLGKDLNKFKELLKEVKTYFEKNNIDLYFSFPPTPNTNENDKIDDLLLNLYSEYGIKTLGTPKDFRYDYEMFYNGLNHVNIQGAKIRSLKLAELIYKKILF